MRKPKDDDTTDKEKATERYADKTGSKDELGNCILCGKNKPLEGAEIQHPGPFPRIYCADCLKWKRKGVTPSVDSQSSPQASSELKDYSQEASREVSEDLSHTPQKPSDDPQDLNPIDIEEDSDADSEVEVTLPLPSTLSTSFIEYSTQAPSSLLNLGHRSKQEKMGMDAR